jgi:hypothetical protein
MDDAWKEIQRKAVERAKDEAIEKVKVDYGKPCPICTDNRVRHTPILYPDQKCIKCGYVDERERETGIHK